MEAETRLCARDCGESPARHPANAITWGIPDYIITNMLQTPRANQRSLIPNNFDVRAPFAKDKVHGLSGTYLRYL